MPDTHLITRLFKPFSENPTFGLDSIQLVLRAVVFSVIRYSFTRWKTGAWLVTIVTERI